MLTATRVPDSVQVETPFAIELRVFNNSSEPRHLTLVLDLDLNGPILDCAGMLALHAHAPVRGVLVGQASCKQSRICNPAACSPGAGVGASAIARMACSCQRDLCIGQKRPMHRVGASANARMACSCSVDCDVRYVATGVGGVGNKNNGRHDAAARSCLATAVLAARC